MSDELKAAQGTLVGSWGNASDEVKSKVREASAELADALDGYKTVIEKEAEAA